MTSNLRLPIVLALTGLALAFALLSFELPTAEPVTIIREVDVGGETVCTAVTAAAGGDFIEGVVGAPRTLNPLLNDFLPVDQQLTDLIFDGLVRYDPTSKRYVPALAQSWETSEDGLTVIFTLKPDRFWHDGEPVTADDVLFSYQLLQEPNFPGASFLPTLWQTVTIEKLDDLTVAFRLAEPYAPFLEATTRGILPQHLLEDVTAVELPNHPFNQFPIGTGPFMVDDTVNWMESGVLRLLPTTPETSHLLDALMFRFYPDFDAVEAAFLAGEIHGYSTVLNHDLPQMFQQSEVQAVSNRANRLAMVLFNMGEMGHEAVAEVEVRRALAQGTNRQQVIDSVLNGQALLVEGPYLSSSWAFSPQIVTPIQYNPISATAVLENQGWQLNEGQVVRQRDESELSLRLVGLRQNSAVITALTEQWTELGVGLDVTLVEDGAALRQMLQEGAFDIALVDVVPTHDPDLYDFWSQEAIVRGQNFGQWNNRRASEALENGRKLWTRAERRPYYDTFLRLYNSDMPAFSLYQYISTFVVHPDVSGVLLGVINTPRDKYATFHQWYLLEEETAVSCQ